VPTRDRPVPFAAAFKYGTWTTVRRLSFSQGMIGGGSMSGDRIPPASRGRETRDTSHAHGAV